jgi:tetratricopeptide (TPR) repeat protein
MRRRVNLKVLVGLPVALLVLGAGFYVVHAWQVRRNAGMLLVKADQAEAANEPARAVQYLERYLQLLPDDLNTQARLGLLVEKHARSDGYHFKSCGILEKVLRADPSRDDLRRTVARQCVALGRHADAREHLNMLCQKSPADGELEDLQGRCEEASGNFDKAADWYRKAIAHSPARVDAYVRLAVILRRGDRGPKEFADADGVMEAMVTANPDSFEARLARARYLRTFGTAEQAAADIMRAKELAPDNAEVGLAVAVLAMAADRLDQARTELRHGLEKNPGNRPMLFAAAQVELRAGNKVEAQKFARQAQANMPDDPPALWAQADLFLDVEEVSEATALIERLKSTTLPAKMVEYLRARVAYLDRNWTESRDRLERCQQGLSDAPEVYRQANLLLAACHQKLGNPDGQLSAYRRAMSGEKDSLAARLGEAAALLEVGQVAAALGRYEELAKDSPAARLTALRLTVQRVLRLPVDQRDWATIEAKWNAVPESAKAGVEGRLVRGELLLAQGKLDEAEAMLRAAQVDHPKALEVRLAQAEVERRRKDDKKVLALLADAERDLGDSVGLRLARARYAADTLRKESAGQLEKLTAPSKDFTRSDEVRLLDGVLQLCMQVEAREQAERLSARLVELQPGDVSTRFARCRLALDGTDAEEAGRRLSDLKQAEGEEGALWRWAEAARMLQFAAPDDNKWVPEARSRLAEARKRRPSWAAVPLLEARIDERQNLVDDAVRHYREAVSLGERQTPVVRRLVQLLQGRKRFNEAQEVLNLVGGPEVGGDLGRMAAETSLFSRQAKPEHVLELARRAVPDDSPDWRDQLWLGQILAVLNKPAEAEKALRKAVEVGGADAPEAFVGLVLFLARNDRLDEAKAVTAEAARRLPADKQTLPLAVCHEAVGDREAAEKQYRAALEAQPDDAVALRNLANFYLRSGQVAKAEAALRGLVEKAKDAELVYWARRTLAVGLALSGEWPKQQEAMKLIEQNLAPPAAAVEDQRARAVILAMQPNRRKDSIRALEESFTKSPPSTDERFLLGRMYEAENDWNQARKQFEVALETPGAKNGGHLAYAAQALIRRGESAVAEKLVRLLNEVEPGTWRAVQTEARWLKARGRGEEAARRLTEFAGKLKPGEGVDVLTVAWLLAEIDQQDAAEKLFKRYVNETRKPESQLELAAWLAQRDRLDESLKLCEGAEATAQPEAVAAVLAWVVRSTKATPAHLARAEKWLVMTVGKPRPVPLVLLTLADLRDQQGKHDDALKLYQRVLEVDPANAIAANNVAMLLALQGRAPEALTIMNRLIERVGPVPAMLDTRAVVYMALDQAEPAVKDLEEVVTAGPTAARYYHLAQAQFRLNNKGASALAFQKARTLGLTPDRLHPLERPALKELQTRLEG